MIKKIFLSLLLFLCLVIPVSTWAAFSNIVSFGDSLSDNGISVVPVYDMEGFTRSSNGAVWVEYLAMNLGTGLDDRAYGGALTGMGNVAAGTSDQYGLQWQIARYGNTLTDSDDISDTLFTVWAGGNDLRGISSPAEANAVIDTALTNIGQAVTSLMTMGARNILIPNIPDLGIIPEFNHDPALSAMATAASSGFNQGLNDLIGLLRIQSTLLGGTIYDLDVFSYINDVIIPGGFFANTEDPWLGSGGRPSDYLFFDNIHPTTDGHWLLAQYAASSVPVPAAIWLMGSGLMLLVGIKRKTI